MSDKIRMQFDFTQEACKELDTLQGHVGASTKAETIRYAMRALQWITEELASGAEILVRREGQTRVAVFPFFSRPHGAEKRSASHKRAAR